MIKKKIFFPVLALAIITAAVATSSFVSAQDTTGPNSLVAAIAQKFNLNEDDVQAVFDEQKAKHQDQIKLNLEQKLNQAVGDGKITEAQKQAIITHFQGMKHLMTNKEEFRNLTKEEIKAKMDERKAQEEAWLSQNGLTHEKLQEIMGGPKGMGHKGMMFKAH